MKRIVADVPHDSMPPPRRAALKSPLRYRFLAYGRSETCVVTTSGRLRKATAWVPLAKVQSFRRVEGPLQRRLGLASIHLDTAGRSVHATLRDRATEELDDVLPALVASARAARRAVA